ncbi:hypothetical protein VMCG_07193 [Cytospora schulzeri]|uniref:Uncharacterized protein n=1 Tax=Cytospora schulzeri TaxID=448051 RepID=A0A423W4Z3_9PEZI|nr:hypothetical protein VMCG_07193 [Valsa malicola]
MSSSRAGSAHGSQQSSDVSSLHYDPKYTQPSQLGEPFKGHLKDKNILKKIKAAGSDIKNARIKGKEHQSSSAPEQGKVVSIQLFNAAWKKVVETVHILSSGTVETNKSYRKSKK